MSFTLASALSGFTQGFAGKREQLRQEERSDARRAEDLGFKERAEARADRQLGLQEQTTAQSLELGELKKEDLLSDRELKQKKQEFALAQIDDELSFIKDPKVKQLMKKLKMGNLQLQDKEVRLKAMDSIDRSFAENGLDTALPPESLKLLKEFMQMQKFAGVGSTRGEMSNTFGADPTKITNSIETMATTYGKMKEQLAMFQGSPEEKQVLKNSIANVASSLESMSQQMSSGRLTSQSLDGYVNTAQDIMEKGFSDMDMVTSIPDRDENESLFNQVSGALDTEEPVVQAPTSAAQSLGNAMESQRAQEDIQSLGAAQPEIQEQLPQAPQAGDEKPIKRAFVSTNPFSNSPAEEVAEIEIKKSILPQGPVDARQMQNVYKPMINEKLAKVDEWLKEARQELGENPSQRELTIWFRNKAGGN